MHKLFDQWLIRPLEFVLNTDQNLIKSSASATPLQKYTCNTTLGPVDLSIFQNVVYSLGFVSNPYPEKSTDLEVKGGSENTRLNFLDSLQSLRAVGTEFQIRVWKELLKIPRGKVITYGELAQRIGAPRSAARAVGQAVGANPIAYFIPCHRVILSSGQIGHYRWGKAKKYELLNLEGKEMF